MNCFSASEEWVVWKKGVSISNTKGTIVKRATNPIPIKTNIGDVLNTEFPMLPKQMKIEPSMLGDIKQPLDNDV